MNYKIVYKYINETKYNNETIILTGACSTLKCVLHREKCCIYNMSIASGRLKIQGENYI